MKNTYNNVTFYKCLSTKQFRMKKLFILFLLYLPAMLVFNACDGGEPAPPPTNQWPKNWYIPQEVLDYFYFKQGSYWVYENDKTGQVDSVFVTTNVKTVTTPTSQGERYEVAAIDAVSSLDGYTYKYGLSMQGSAGCIKDGSKWPCYIIDCNKFKTGDVLGSTSYLILPFQKGYGGQANGSFESKITMKDTLNDIEIDGKSYLNIVIVNLNPSLTNNKKNYNYYWSKNIGIVKKENLTDTENWNLIRYHINK